mgnify:CR=1|tara:strand:+ start:263 stop:415 length:153 start_codon:yes stop_codon:yes gene_type:complete
MILAVLTALLAWLWWSDTILIDKCQDAGGSWDAEARVCRIALPAQHGLWT